MQKRLFIGFKIINTPLLLTLLNQIKSTLSGGKIKWVDPENMHLTLTFLGDTEDKLIPAIVSAMDSVCDITPSFNIELRSIGIFKNINHPTVLWIGVKADKIMSELKYKLDNYLNNLGFTIEERQYKPHLTIGRIKNINDKKNLQSVLDQTGNREVSAQTVYGITLFESILTTNGPIYKVMHISNLLKQISGL
jgi:RNA 2',3'-cyclic 3'-phosphodiesterase